MSRASLAIAVAVALAAPAGAAAQSPTPAPAPTPTLRISPVDGRNRGVDAYLPGQGMKVIGTLRPYVAGQSVTVRYSRGRRLLAAVAAPVVAIGHDTGRFVTQIPVGGRFGFAVTIVAEHAAAPLLG